MNVKIQDFYQAVEDVKGLIDRIRCQTEEVERKQCVILTTQSKDKKISSELEKLNSEIKKNSSLVQAKLKSMQSDKPTDENCQSVSVLQRIYKNQSHLTQCFVEVMRRYYKAQTDFRDKCKAQIQRQLEIVDKVTTDEELEEMLNCDGLAIFISDMKCGSQLSSQAALHEIESRHFDIMSLESSIRELHDIFTDIALLVEIQGELMNNIEKNVTGAADYVDNSKIETEKAIEYKKSSFKLIPPGLLRSFRKRSKTASDQSTTKL